MIGVTSAEAYVLLNNEEMELGLETETRNKLVSDLVTSSFHHHQKEIFSAVITEYTDWAQVARHPITTRQSLTLTAIISLNSLKVLISVLSSEGLVQYS